MDQRVKEYTKPTEVPNITFPLAVDLSMKGGAEQENNMV